MLMLIHDRDTQSCLSERQAVFTPTLEARAMMRNSGMEAADTNEKYDASTCHHMKIAGATSGDV